MDFEDALPAAIGATSFRVKGHVYQKMKDDMETLAGGLASVLDRLEAPEVRAFLAQSFAGGGWYDALPLGPITSTHARLCGRPLHPFCRERGRIIATFDVPGIYKAMLRLFSPTTLVSRLPRVATLYFSFGKATVDQLAPNRARIALGNLPYTLAPMLAGVVEGFVAVALEQSGAKGVQVRTFDVTYDGQVVDGVPTATVRHESTWE
ncbi:MAG: hypothetical protein JWP97_3658 [Labilithrix sp.]|nr:hypothetical protein [Labilithrix sp.]